MALSNIQFGKLIKGFDQGIEIQSGRKCQTVKNTQL
jgi:hypothetical protein